MNTNNAAKCWWTTSTTLGTRSITGLIWYHNHHNHTNNNNDERKPIIVAVAYVGANIVEGTVNWCTKEKDTTATWPQQKNS